jgi:Domain of unknown function (DUF4351)
MTRTPHDLFAKQHLEALLETLGTVTASRKVTSETREVDLWFIPHAHAQESLSALGLLGRMVFQSCVIEPFRNSIQPPDVSSCIGKLIDLTEIYRRQAKREHKSLREMTLPQLWILSPTVSNRVVQGFGAVHNPKWSTGFYFLPPLFRTALVAIHQLPVNRDTLWLRLMGRGAVQAQAIAELLALPANHPMKRTTMEYLAVLQISLNLGQNLSTDEKVLAMNLSPVYEKWRQETLDEGLQQGLEQGLEQGVQRGRQEEGRSLVRRLLNRRIGTISPTSEAKILTLSISELEILCEALLDFSSSADLDDWLRTLGA